MTINNLICACLNVKENTKITVIIYDKYEVSESYKFTGCTEIIMSDISEKLVQTFDINQKENSLVIISKLD